MTIAEYAIKRKTITLALLFSLFVAGLFSYLDLPRLEDPEFTIKDALIITQYPGANPVQVEEQVTDILENEIQKMPQVKEVSSISRAGQSIITVSMMEHYGKDSLPDVWTILRAKIRDVSASLPANVGEPRVVDDFGDVYGFMYALTGDGFSHKELYEYAKFLRKELLLVDGIGKVDLWGVKQEAIYIDVSPEMLTSVNRNLSELETLFTSQNSVIPAGNVEAGSEYLRIQPASAISAVEDIENLLVSLEGSSAAYLKDMADVSRDYREPSGQLMSYNGTPAIGLAISNSADENVVEIGAQIEAILETLHTDIPIGLEAHPVILQNQAVERALDGFIASLVQAVAIVVIVLLLFMGARTGLIIGFVLIVTVVLTFNAMQLLGLALERISLGALVIALGMLVDNAIVVCEGMQVRMRQGKDRLQSAIIVVKQNQWPLFGATVIAILAFASIGLSQDATGEYCRSLFWVILSSLFISWVLALTLTPLLCYWFMPSGDESTENDDPYAGVFFRKYEQVLHTCLKHRLITLCAALGLFVLAVYGFGFVKQSFFPKSTSPYFMVHYWLPEGTDIRTTKQDVEKIEAYIQTLEGVENVTGFVGEGAPRFTLVYSPEKANSSYAFLLVEVEDYKLADPLTAEIRDHLQLAFIDAEPKFQKFSLGPSPKSSIEVRFSGADEKVLRQLSEQAKRIMRTASAQAIRDDWRQKVKVIEPQFLSQKAVFSGVSRADLNLALLMNFTGLEVGVYREGNELLPIIARSEFQNASQLSDINDLQVWSSAAATYVPISEVVDDFKTTWKDTMIQRRDRKRTITVGAEPAPGALASTTIEKIRADIESMTLPKGYSLEWGGEFESSGDAQGSLALGIAISFACMVLISIVMFNSLRQPAIIWAVVPFSLVGVSLGLLVTDLAFGFMALLGFLSLSGMLIKNVIVLLEQIDIENQLDKDRYTALLDAAKSRARPVLMAAGTTVLGMIPLAADPFFSGMSVTIMGGLSFASLLTLFLVPVLYSLCYSVKKPD